MHIYIVYDNLLLFAHCVYYICVYIVLGEITVIEYYATVA